MPKSEWVEWDCFPEPRRRRPRIERVEILPPQQPERGVNITVRHHHHAPQIAALGLVVVAFLAGRFLVIPLIVVIVLAVTFPALARAWLLIVALVTGAALYERWHGRPF